jgi:heterodisulfide reductase subunit A-like polyferredoxin
LKAGRKRLNHQDISRARGIHEIMDMDKEKNFMARQIIGSAMVVGGGIAGMQAAIDMADAGYYVYLVEKSASIGGVMSQLDKTFPTNDCAM